MEEINKISNRMMYPIYMIEKFLIILYIYGIILTSKNVWLSSIQCHPYFPFWLRQYDETDDTNYYDEFVKGIIQISVTGNVWNACRYVHGFETKHYSVDIFYVG